MIRIVSPILYPTVDDTVKLLQFPNAETLVYVFMTPEIFCAEIIACKIKKNKKNNITISLIFIIGFVH